MSIDDLAMSQELWVFEMLCRSRVLIPCPHHEGVYTEGENDLQDGFKYAMKAFKNNEEGSPFSSAREMTDTLQLVYHENCGNDVCPFCFRHAPD